MAHKVSYLLSSLRKYAILSPHLRQPMLCSVASRVEYISGLIPSLYKLSGLVRLTIENLFV